MPNSYDTFLLTLSNVYTAVQKEKGCPVRHYSLEAGNLFSVSSKPSLCQLKNPPPRPSATGPAEKFVLMAQREFVILNLTLEIQVLKLIIFGSCYLVRDINAENM